MALAEQKASTDQVTLTNIKIRWQNLENALEQSDTDLQNAKESANQQVVVFTQKHAEEKGGLTTTIDFQGQKIAKLEALKS